MDSILPAYNDPLFSIFILVTLVLFTAIVSYLMGSYKEEKQQKKLKNFFGKISADECTLEVNKMPFERGLVYPLSLLAKTLTLQGDYQKAISIYLYLNTHISSFEEKEEILEAFGRAYLRGGFLKRSEAMFLEILRRHPRNTNALYYLEVVYELLNDYDKAKETLRPLQVMGERTEKLEAHLLFSKALKEYGVSPQEKLKYLKECLENRYCSYRQTIQELFRRDSRLAWESVDTSRLELILDILWFLPISNLNLDIITASNSLQNIYIARGVLPLNNALLKSDIFSIDMIVAARNGGHSDMDLHFTYGCSNCKQQFPITFVRCPECYAIDSIQIKESIAKKQSQTGYSLL